jgi:CheY-like chemotaxis protein/anti-sigma regulatory factor (Ser/Thr protein kinase)
MPTVLVVDDSEVDRRLVGGLLERQGRCGVLYACDGKEALQSFATSIPDLVLTDLHMPEMNGLELVAAIKDEFPLTPVVLMTALGSEEIASEALRRGAASYVPKRKLADDLVETVERVLSAAREDRTHSRLMHHLSACTALFVIGNDLGMIRALASYLQQMLRCMPLGDETERLRVGIAVEEAIKNAFYHGSLEVRTGEGWPDRRAIDRIVSERLLEEPYRSRKIHVEANVTRSEATFTIRDEGPGFDATQLPDSVAAVISNESKAGRGIALLCTIMDEVNYNPIGNEVTLVKRPPIYDDSDVEEPID